MIEGEEEFVLPRDYFWKSASAAYVDHQHVLLYLVLAFSLTI